MRLCLRCQTPMVEDCDIKQELSGYRLTVSNKTNVVFAGRIGPPCVAICPKCGEISLYIEDVSKLNIK